MFEFRFLSPSYLKSFVASKFLDRGFSLISPPLLRKRSCQGFSLIEIMVAVSIIAITFGAIVTTYSAAQRGSRDAKRQADLRTIQGALQQYYADQNNFPVTLNLGAGGELSVGTGSNKKTYLKDLPIDPTSGQSYCYHTSCSSSTSCHSYTLYTALENPPSDAGSYSCSSRTYNFTLTPP